MMKTRPRINFKSFRLTLLFFLILPMGIGAKVLWFLNGKTEFERLTLRLGSASVQLDPADSFVDSGIYIEFSADGTARLHSPEGVEMSVPFDVSSAQSIVFRFNLLRSSLISSENLLGYYRGLDIYSEEYHLGAEINPPTTSTFSKLVIAMGLGEVINPPIYTENLDSDFFSEILSTISDNERAHLSKRIRDLGPVQDNILDWIDDPRFEARIAAIEQVRAQVCSPLPWKEEKRLQSPDEEVDVVLVSRTGPRFGVPKERSTKQTNIYVVPHGEVIENQSPYEYGELDHYFDEMRSEASFMGFDLMEVDFTWQDSDTVMVKLKRGPSSSVDKQEVKTLTVKSVPRSINISYSID